MDMRAKGWMVMGLMVVAQTLWQQPKLRSAAHKSAVILLKQALTALEQAQYLAAITREEAADLLAEVEFRHRQTTKGATIPPPATESSAPQATTTERGREGLLRAEQAI